MADPVTFDLIRDDVAFSRTAVNQPDIFTDLVSFQNQVAGTGLGRLPVSYTGADAYANAEQGVVETIYFYADGSIQIFFQDGAGLFAASAGGFANEASITISIAYSDGRSLSKSFYQMRGLTGFGDSFHWTPSNSADVREIYNFATSQPQTGTLSFERVAVLHQAAGGAASGPTGAGIGAARKVAPTVHQARAGAVSGAAAATLHDANTRLVVKRTGATGASSGTAAGLGQITRTKPGGAGTVSGGTGAVASAAVKIRRATAGGVSGSAAAIASAARKLTPSTKATAAGTASGASGAQAHPFKRVPTAPLGPRNIRLLEVTQTLAVLQWDPPPGDGSSDLQPVTGYDIQFFGQPWASTGRGADTVYRLSSIGTTTIQAGTFYRVRVRAINATGAGTPSEPFAFESGAVLEASAPKFVQAVGISRSAVRVSWSEPEDLGGGRIEAYEVETILPGEVTGRWERTAGPELSSTVRGLAEGRRYRFRVRAVNQAGAGAAIASSVEAVARDPVQAPSGTGRRIPLLPEPARQSLIVRLQDVDCRLTVWWQPWDEGWYGSLEIPVNTPAVQARRLAANAGLLDRIVTPLTVNIVCRPLDSADDRLEPGRNAWAEPSHGLFVEG